MPQKHMPLELFSSILAALPMRGLNINLQGEGEPFLHPQFTEILALTVQHGQRPYTITNGTRLPVQLVQQYFPSIGISIDTLDPVLAEKIGRLNLPKVWRNLHALLDAGYPAAQITIHTVNFGQEINSLQAYLRSLGITRHIIQPLQGKEDYRYRYANNPVWNITPKDTYSCRFVDEQRMLFFNIDGVMMPCCFIKNAAHFTSREQILASLQQGVIPECCRGCRELY